MIIYWLTKAIFGVFAKIFLRLKVEGVENLPQGGFIMVANHASSLDPFVINSALPRYLRWLVIHEYFDLWQFGWLLRQMRFIRVKNNLPKEALRALSAGEIIGLFPEGRRTWDGQLGQFRSGAASLARASARPVVPVAIQGTFGALSRTAKRLKLHQVTVRIGKPLFFSGPENKKDSARVDEENSAKIRLSIANLLAE